MKLTKLKRLLSWWTWPYDGTTPIPLCISQGFFASFWARKNQCVIWWTFFCVLYIHLEFPVWLTKPLLLWLLPYSRWAKLSSCFLRFFSLLGAFVVETYCDKNTCVHSYVLHAYSCSWYEGKKEIPSCCGNFGLFHWGKIQYNNHKEKVR